MLVPPEAGVVIGGTSSMASKTAPEQRPSAGIDQAVDRVWPAAHPPVPGTVWEESSGTKWIAIYDELYRGTRWELLPPGPASK